MIYFIIRTFASCVTAELIILCYPMPDLFYTSLCPSPAAAVLCATFMRIHERGERKSRGGRLIRDAWFP